MAASPARVAIRGDHIMLAILTLSFIAVFAALGGLATAGLALMPVAGLGAPALFAAPAFGLVSLVSGVLAAAMVLRRQG
jgi:hypothetical protein